jgi:hypothetical protein
MLSSQNAFGENKTMIKFHLEAVEHVKGVFGSRGWIQMAHQWRGYRKWLLALMFLGF